MNKQQDEEEEGRKRKGIAKDGEVIHFGMAFMDGLDAVQSAVAVSGASNYFTGDATNWQGPLVLADSAAERVYQAHCKRLSDAWRGGATDRKVDEPRTVADAFAAHERWLQNAWRAA